MANVAQSHAVQLTVSEPVAGGDSAILVAVRYTVTTPFGPKLEKTATTHRDVTNLMKPAALAELTALYQRIRLVVGEQMEAVAAREAAQLHVIDSGVLATHELTGEI